MKLAAKASLRLAMFFLSTRQRVTGRATGCNRPFGLFHKTADHDRDAVAVGQTGGVAITRRRGEPWLSVPHLDKLPEPQRAGFADADPWVTRGRKQRCTQSR